MCIIPRPCEWRGFPTAHYFIEIALEGVMIKINGCTREEYWVLISNIGNLINENFCSKTRNS